MSRPAKTEGLEWLYLSMAAFNGSGYADKLSCESYVESYRYYKLYKKDRKAVDLLDTYPEEALAMGEHLCCAKEAGRTPSQKSWAKFEKFKNGVDKSNNVSPEVLHW